MAYEFEIISINHSLRIVSRCPSIFYLCNSFDILQSHDSPVGIALGYGLNDRDSRVRFPAGAGNFSLHHRVPNGSGAHPTSYPVGTEDSLSVG
jgi:hypothetical protein